MRGARARCQGGMRRTWNAAGAHHGTPQARAAELPAGRAASQPATSHARPEVPGGVAPLAAPLVPAGLPPPRAARRRPGHPGLHIGHHGATQGKRRRLVGVQLGQRRAATAGACGGEGPRPAPRMQPGAGRCRPLARAVVAGLRRRCMPRLQPDAACCLKPSSNLGPLSRPPPPRCVPAGCDADACQPAVPGVQPALLPEAAGGAARSVAAAALAHLRAVLRVRVRNPQRSGRTPGHFAPRARPPPPRSDASLQHGRRNAPSLLGSAAARRLPHSPPSPCPSPLPCLPHPAATTFCPAAPLWSTLTFAGGAWQHAGVLSHSTKRGPKSNMEQAGLVATSAMLGAQRCVYRSKALLQPVVCCCPALQLPHRPDRLPARLLCVRPAGARHAAQQGATTLPQRGSQSSNAFPRPPPPLPPANPRGACAAAVRPGMAGNKQKAS